MKRPSLVANLGRLSNALVACGSTEGRPADEINKSRAKASGQPGQMDPGGGGCGIMLLSVAI